MKVRVKRMVDGEQKSKIIDATMGRLIFNEVIPQDLGFVDRSNPENLFDLEIDFLVDKKALSKLLINALRYMVQLKPQQFLTRLRV